MSGTVNNAERRFQEHAQRARTLRQNANAARQRAQEAVNHPLLKKRSMFNKTFKRRTENERKNKNKAKTLRNNLQRAANKAEENATTAKIMANNSRARWQNLRNAADRKAAENRERSLRGPTPAQIPRPQQTPAYIAPVPGHQLTGINMARARGTITSPAAQALIDIHNLTEKGSIQEQMFGTSGHEPIDFLYTQGYIIGRPGMQQRDMQMIQEQKRLQDLQDHLNNSSGRSQQVRNAYQAQGKKGLVPFYRKLHRWRT